MKEERRVLGLLRNEPASSATGIVYLHNSILRIVLLLLVVLHSTSTVVSHAVGDSTTYIWNTIKIAAFELHDCIFSSLDCLSTPSQPLVKVYISVYKILLD